LWAGRGEKATAEPGMVVHTCNLSIQKWRQEEPKFKARLGYIAGPPWWQSVSFTAKDRVGNSQKKTSIEMGNKNRA
jgi:hypothetical protein